MGKNIHDTIFKRSSIVGVFLLNLDRPYRLKYSQVGHGIFVINVRFNAKEQFFLRKLFYSRRSFFLSRRRLFHDPVRHFNPKIHRINTCALPSTRVRTLSPSNLFPTAFFVDRTLQVCIEIDISNLNRDLIKSTDLISISHSRT